MFQDKKNDSTNGKENFDSTFAMASAPIHLMKMDLEEVKNPQKASQEQSSEPAIKFDNLSEKQKNSPFFKPAAPQKIEENKPKEAPMPLPPLPKKEITEEIKKESPREFGSSTFIQPQKEAIRQEVKKPVKSSGLKKLVVILIIFFLFLVFGAGGYYFWLTKNVSPQAQLENDQIPTASTEIESQVVIPEPAPVKQLEISTEKPNYISIDIASADKASINSQIDLYLKRAEELKISAPAELIVTDIANNPIAFNIFAEKAEIALPAQIISLLRDTFSLYIFNDTDNYRLGLSVGSLNNIKLKAEMLKEEKNLILDLAPILKNPDNKIFTQSAYQMNLYKNTNQIRFSNIVSPEYLSIDYAIVKKNLIIGTTKNTAFAIIDSLSAPKKVPVTENKPKTTVTTESVKASENSPVLNK